MKIPKLPDEWPILEPKNMTYGELEDPLDPDNRRCLLGWAYFAIGKPSGSRLNQGDRHTISFISRSIIGAACDICKNKKNEISLCSVGEINDFILSSNKQRALVWNYTGAKLGYTEGNPEKKRLKEKRK